ncbi:MAG: bifunctional 2-C-methyl-D-erythritol 4-phosphate cytidylyltransferase/2-C-methyl-D-erythritol 2,4-cyclodiphosphate synthase [Alphaproteobacteria bacterium]|nr:bifunctional 2-C-methyl-D-erythritol 4-phosphate cytidylyltransferase/2-C-methyl-D-erythritol 2,4-cyclodiphosphate synthase [Alphaproteobacteria bacterium]
MPIAALVVAAGKGERAGGAVPKQFADLAGRPLLRWSLEAFAAHPAIGPICVVADPAHADLVLAAAAGIDVSVAAGGATRTASVRAGVAALAPGAPDAVLIHDAARPGLTAGVIDALLAALRDADGAAPGLPVVDALKRTQDGLIVEDVARAGLVRIQTPQAFRFAPFAAALAAAPTDAAFDDDIALARAAGLSTRVVSGDPRLMKVTYPEDFAQAGNLLAPPGAGAVVPLVGSGYDAHRFGPGDHVTLCGVKIPHTHGLVGHSDADAAWHALTDALLGAIGAGDIGDHFPPSDPRWRGAPSGVFLRHAADLVAQAGGRIVNVDVTVICERPRVKPHREAMRQATAELLGLPLARVSVKATTTEGMGFTGREEGLAAQASVSLLAPETTDVR